jgi:hypothetical protein
MFVGVALLSLVGCAEMPNAIDARAADAHEAQAAADHERVLRLMEEQNKLLGAEIAAERDAAAERAELTRKVDELSRQNHELTEAVARLDREPERTSAPAPAPTPTQVFPLIDTSETELARLRAKLVEAGFNPVTLTPAQVRALIRNLRPPRPIDVESPFAL